MDAVVQFEKPISKKIAKVVNESLSLLHALVTMFYYEVRSRRKRVRDEFYNYVSGSG